MSIETEGLSFPRKACRHCGGTGHVFKSDKIVGRAMQKLRITANVGLRELARELGKSGSYVVQLEAGAKWTEARMRQYIGAVEKLQADEGSCK